MKTHFLLSSILFFAGCTPSPRPIDYGSDACHQCRMTVLDPRFGAELITAKGKVYVFDDLICMIGFSESDEMKVQEIHQMLVSDYINQNQLLDVHDAVYIQGENVHSPMNGNAAAFRSEQEAQMRMTGITGVMLTWDELIQNLK